MPTERGGYSERGPQKVVTADHGDPNAARAAKVEARLGASPSVADLRQLYDEIVTRTDLARGSITTHKGGIIDAWNNAFQAEFTTAASTEDRIRLLRVAPRFNENQQGRWDSPFWAGLRDTVKAVENPEGLELVSQYIAEIFPDHKRRQHLEKWIEARRRILAT